MSFTEARFESADLTPVFHLSSSTQGEIFPTQVCDDSCRQGVPEDVDHGPEPVPAGTEDTTSDSKLKPSLINVSLTHRIQSMATMRVMSSGGRPTEVRTITMVTRPA